MPKAVKNINRKKLSAEEISEFEQVGYSPEEIEKFESLLKEPSWDFWSRSDELYLSLSAGSNLVSRNGKMVTEDTVKSAKFSKHYLSTADRETARLIFLSDPYRNGTIKLSSDQVIDEANRKYQEFKTAVFSSPANIERLKSDLANAS